ncbi:type II inositol 1,4,5-trisphosphate 5-phosphatase [Eublepharis macularius]|uniref:phosphoinositide 5-phosphatase n=1 Tax=Eublepharis macularius TaxID=481883 RepID=A0AA97KH14_EUBMA|nr:type II inositol 1,4,5-trisphosphate 5-phosphatase [Eublepharis macularius]XP_054855270.1 type II inositol 1,4,5-trisphosphate 5-phosphatase [Eublepharis macularius]
MESRLLSLVESHGKSMICLYTHRRMAITAEDVCLDRILLIQDGFTVEEVTPENDLQILGSDVTVQITSGDAELLVRLPFGSQTQMFLQEVRRRCSPGVARSEDATAVDPEQSTSGEAKTASTYRDQKPKTASEMPTSEQAQGLSTRPPWLRDTLIQSWLTQKEDSYTHLQSFRFFVGTYNVNGQSPQESLQPWLSQDKEPPDVYCVGFQELDLSKEAFFFNDTPKEEEWFKAVTKGLHPGAKYAKVKLVRLVGILLLLYVRTELAMNISEVEAETVGTGIMGRMGNKGGVGIRFQFHNTTVCVVNAHLAAHAEEYERRNQEVQDICARMQFHQLEPSRPLLTIDGHDIVLWLGDLNYQLEEQDTERVKKLIQAQDFQALYRRDQLKIQMDAKVIFQDFREGEISFQPTYKYIPGSDDWDDSEKCHAPAWCDRILWRGKTVSQLSYQSHTALKNSDHKPVSALFDVGIKVMDEKRYRKAFEEIVRSLDKMENASIPSVTLSKREFLFKDVKYLQRRVETFTICNGPVPCQFEFINKPDEDTYCKPWLIAKPSKGFLLPGSELMMELELLVNKSTATALNSGEGKLEDILVLHLDRGKDYFLSVSGNYLPSCFGCPIQALCYMKEPIRETLPKAVRELTLMPLSTEDAFLEEKPLDIPKELWMMVNHLYRNACQQEDLFQQPGLRPEFDQIRDWLDTETLDVLVPVGSNHAVAEALLLFLESLPEPVICYKLYKSCLECANSYEMSSQVVAMLPKCHQNVFRYLVAFLRELLKYSGKNHLDVNILATIFGGLLVRPPSGHTKPGTAEKQKAQQFILQFLCQQGDVPGYRLLQR